MNLKEKIGKIDNLKARQDELKNLFEEAEKSGNSEEMERTDKEIQQLAQEIDKTNESYKKERENRITDEKINGNLNDLLTRGNNVKNRINEYNDILNNGNISIEDRAKIQRNIDNLNEANSAIKSEIYDKALEDSKLSFKDGEIYPTEEIKKYNGVLSELEKERKTLEEQREKQREIIEENKNKMNEQFNIAIEKYQELLAANKISQEEFDSRIQAMHSARDKDIEMMDKSLEGLDKNINDKIAEIEDIKGKLSELEEKEKIFDEYNNVYYELFGETLESFHKERNIKNNDDKNKNNKNNKTITNQAVDAKTSNGVVNGTVVANEIKEEEEPKIVVTSKSVFNELYKKLTNGTITDKELNALTDVLSDKDNYDKYGITTGMIFNKARKILKYQGNRTFKNIDEFLKTANTFSEDIKFDTSIEKDEVLSHEVLNSWKDSQDKLIFTDTVFSIEKYIEKIEAYKEAGNELTDEQQKVYKDAMNIKENLSSYRKALNMNEEVAMERDTRTQNSIFYGMLKNRIKNNSTKALPEENDSKNRGVVYINEPFGVELGSMVNHEVHESSELSDKGSKVKSRNTEEQVK